MPGAARCAVPLVPAQQRQLQAPLERGGFKLQVAILPILNRLSTPRARARRGTGRARSTA
jgi:hypothetical protein